MSERDQSFSADRIENISQQIQSGAQYENPTIELKREFWNVSTDDGKVEFAKDLTIMANSQYGAGNIIVGIDGQTGELHHTIAPTDFANLANIINRKVLEPFTVEFFEIQVQNKNIIVVHIPHSYNKPHMLREDKKQREMFIPVRKGTRTRAADKYDLDQMYAEREKIVIPPYRLELFVGGDTLLIMPQSSRHETSWNGLINIINTGSRLNIVTAGSLVIYINDEEFSRFALTAFRIQGVSGDWETLSQGDLLKISENDAKRVNLKFQIPSNVQFSKVTDRINSYSARLTLIDIKGNEFSLDDIRLRNYNA